MRNATASPGQDAVDEKELDFTRACDGTRFAPGSRYYDFAQLEACYRQAP